MDGAIRIGGGAPVVVQSMTNTDTADARATAEQVKALADAGSEIVRITVDTPKAAAAVPTIRERLEAAGCHVPLVGDFTTTATSCSPNTRLVPKPWTSTGSIRVQMSRP